MKNNKPFLAATAIEEFWDTSYPIVFLGNWCKRYSRKEIWENIISETPLTYFDEKKSNEVYLYLSNIFERLLFVLHNQMNQIHGTDFSLRYWRIVLGSWLIYYIHAMYDRYENLEHFVKLYPDFTSICLDKKCFIIPKDTIHFACHLRNDDFNLQIYSSILAEMGYKFPAKELTITTPDVNLYFTGQSRGVKNILKHIYKWTCKTFQNNKQVLLRNTYFSYSSLFKLMLETRAVAWPCIYGYEDLPDFSVNHEARRMVGNLDFGEDKFEKTLISLIPFAIPQSMIEGFSFLREKVKDEFVSGPKAIMSGISWWFDNTFRIWAAESAEKGTMLLGTQHGGNYGFAANLLQKDIELGIVDKFYSWGWKYSDTYAEVIPMPAPKLVETKKKSLNKGGDVLYVLAGYSRYLLQFPLSTDYWDDYFLNQVKFISHLSGQIMAKLRIRPYREDYGWDVWDRIRDQFPQVKIEAWDKPFPISLNNCSVYVSDHPLASTTFIEALVSNKPTIIFYNPNFAANEVRDEAKDLFKQLKTNAIIFDDLITAARHLNSVYDCIESWWNEPKRQMAIRNFLDKYGKTSPTWLTNWSEEILSIAKDRNLCTVVNKER